MATGILPGDPAHNDDGVRVGPQHQPLKRANLLQVALSGSPIDPLPQVTYIPVGLLPVDLAPIGLPRGYVCRTGVRHPTFPFEFVPLPRSMGSSPVPRQPAFASG